MIDETIEELRNGIAKAHESLKRELSKIRTGRANAAILDGVRVMYYGESTPLKQVASVSIPEARMLVLKPFEKAMTPVIEKAINEANIGLNPSNDGDLIRLPMPPLTEERRKDLTKVARKVGEDGKIAIRSARRDANDMIDELKKEKEIGEDDAKRAQKDIDEVVKAGTNEVDAIVSKKEADILEV